MESRKNDKSRNSDKYRRGDTLIDFSLHEKSQDECVKTDQSLVITLRVRAYVTRISAIHQLRTLNE